MDSELKASIWPIFVEEAREHLRALGSAILEMERFDASRPADLIEATCRTAHSLKGSAGSVGLMDVERVAHAIEDVIETCPPQGTLSAGAVQAALRGVQAITDALEREDKSDDGRIPEVDTLIAMLHAAQEHGPAAPAHASTVSVNAALTPLPESFESLPAEAGATSLDRLNESSRELWPVFRGEIEHQLVQLHGIIRAAGPNEVLSGTACDEVQKLSDHLVRSARLLGLPSFEASALRLFHEAPSLKGAVALVEIERLESLFQQISDGDEPSVTKYVLGTAVAVEPQHTDEDRITALEALLLPITGPDEQGRPERVTEALVHLKALAQSANSHLAEGIFEVRAVLESLQRKDVPPATLTRALVSGVRRLGGVIRGVELAAEELHSSGQTDDDAEQPTEGAEESAKVSAKPAVVAEPVHEAVNARSVDKTIRISTRTLDSLSEQIESVLAARNRQGQRAKVMQNVTGIVGTVLELCQKTAANLKLRGEDALERPLRDGIDQLHSIQQALSALTRENLRENDELRLASTAVREELRDLRMVTAASLLDPLRVTVRDVAGRLGKKVQFVARGAEVRLDRRIVEELKDPLLHLVRNAIDHGLEMPADRSSVGKLLEGRLEVSVEQRGHRIWVAIADDGKGLSIERIRATAVKRGLLDERGAKMLSDAEAIRLIFQPGFSTAESVTAISGRGVGLDVVNERITRLLGAVNVESTPGKGTRFILDVPLTMSATLAMLIRCGGECFAMPVDNLERVIRVRRGDISSVGGRRVVAVDDAKVPFGNLADVLKLSTTTLAMDRGEHQPCLLLSGPSHRVVMAVEEILGQQEIVIHGMPRQMGSHAHLRGTAILDDGQIVPVLNGHELARAALPRMAHRAARIRRSILVADDSLTTRSMMKAVLEMAGYEVIPAADGAIAFEVLQKNYCGLVVSDVQMPNLDGLGLTRKIKSDKSLSKIPVILVTSLDSQDDRAAGLEAGADGYLVKREVERGRLLELVRQLMPEDT